MLVRDIKFVVQHDASPSIAFLRSAIAQSLAGSSVQVIRNPITRGLREVRHACALREILT
jgi:hypothetical protein